jgi:hypothetical protein
MLYNMNWVETRIQSNTKRFELRSNPLPGITSVQQTSSVDGKLCVDAHLKNGYSRELRGVSPVLAAVFNLV